MAIITTGSAAGMLADASTASHYGASHYSTSIQDTMERQQYDLDRQRYEMDRYMEQYMGLQNQPPQQPFNEELLLLTRI